MEVLVLVAIMMCLFMGGCLLGYYTGCDMNTFIKHENNTIKRENERLNAELEVLTKRDSKGRFTGGK
jgi:hypothetical protein